MFGLGRCGLRQRSNTPWTPDILRPGRGRPQRRRGARFGAGPAAAEVADEAAATALTPEGPSCARQAALPRLSECGRFKAEGHSTVGRCFLVIPAASRRCRKVTRTWDGGHLMITAFARLGLRSRRLTWVMMPIGGGWGVSSSRARARGFRRGGHSAGSSSPDHSPRADDRSRMWSLPRALLLDAVIPSIFAARSSTEWRQKVCS